MQAVAKTFSCSPSAAAGLVLLALLAMPSTARALEWQIHRVDEGAKPSLALSADGTPQIAYMEESLSGFVKHAVWSDGSWDIQTVATGYFYGPVATAIDSADNPHIVFHDHQDTRFDQSKGDQVHALWDGTVWQLRTISHPGHDGWDNAITMVGTVPRTASIDPAQFNSTVGVEYWDGDRVEAIGSGPIAYEYGTSIAVDDTGVPHISYFDTANGRLRHALRGSDGWSLTTVDAESGAGMYSSLDFDPDGNPGISYYIQETETTGVVRYASFDGSVWRIQTVAPLANVISGFVGARNLTSLEFGSDGNPRITYSSMSTLHLATWNGSEWEVETVLGQPAPGRVLGGLTSSRVGPGDSVHITFYEMPANLSTSTGVVWYAVGTPANRPPVFPPIQIPVLAEGERLSVDLGVIDPDGDALTFVTPGLPEGARINDGILEWTPGFEQAGEYPVVFEISDGVETVPINLTITVSNTNRPASFGNVLPPGTAVLAISGQGIVFSTEPADPDDDDLSVTWSVDGQTIAGETGSTFTYTTAGADESVISVALSDGLSTVTRKWRLLMELRADFDGNGRVDFADFLEFVGSFGKSRGESQYESRFDLDADDRIDFDDFLEFVSFFGVRT